MIIAYRYSQIKVENSRKKNNSNISIDIKRNLSEQLNKVCRIL